MRELKLPTKVSVLIVGSLGNTGSTLIGALALRDQEILTGEEMPSSLPKDLGLHLGGPKIVSGGWDFEDDDVLSVVRQRGLIPAHLLDKLDGSKVAQRQFPPVSTMLDFSVPSAGGRLSAESSVEDGVELIKADIAEFRRESDSEHVIVIYLGSPSLPSAPPLSTETSWPGLLRRASSTVPANLIYAMAAIDSEADILDFTPSEGLTAPALVTRAEAMGVQIVGRDGSTGQTMLKAAIAEMLVLRGLRLRSWFSSNHLGNHDGLVLSNDQFAWLKIQDKKRGLTELIPGSEYEHVVSIDYVESKGDQKEAYDSIRAEDMFGGQISLRTTWEAWDSALAVAMLIDLIDLIVLGHALGLTGLQRQLGFFFKAPLGGPAESPSRGHATLLAFYLSRLEAEASGAP